MSHITVDGHNYVIAGYKDGGREALTVWTMQDRLVCDVEIDHNMECLSVTYRDGEDTAGNYWEHMERVEQLGELEAGEETVRWAISVEEV